jgi:EDD domain protein, DegV family
MVQLVADSTCDILKETREKLNLEMIPLTVFFDDGAYKDGIDLTHEEFYEKLGKSSKLPTTAQVNPSQFEDVFRRITDRGDDIVCFCISKELSGTLFSAMIAADAVAPGRIFCVDTRCASFGSYLLINEAAKMRDSGKSAREIYEKVQELAGKIKYFSMIDSLKYLKMGGRISGAAAMIGELLGIHPIIQVDGDINVVSKVRGYKAAFNKLLELFQAEPADLQYSVAIGHSNNPLRLSELIEFFRPYLETAEVITGNLGAVIGSHIGPGGIGVAYIAK